MLGLKRGTVALVPYCDEWPQLFVEEQCALRAAIGHLAADIQHIGSTAVPGLPAKPILDIAVAVREARDVESCIAPLATLGYEFLGDRCGDGDWFFAKGPDDLRTHYVHMVEVTSAAWSQWLAFRDALTNDDRARDAYAALKHRLLCDSEGNRKAYTEGKEAFIREVATRG